MRSNLVRVHAGTIIQKTGVRMGVKMRVKVSLRVRVRRLGVRVKVEGVVLCVEGERGDRSEAEGEGDGWGRERSEQLHTCSRGSTLRHRRAKRNTKAESR